MKICEIHNCFTFEVDYGFHLIVASVIFIGCVGVSLVEETEKRMHIISDLFKNHITVGILIAEEGFATIVFPAHGYIAEVEAGGGSFHFRYGGV